MNRFAFVFLFLSLSTYSLAEMDNKPLPKLDHNNATAGPAPREVAAANFISKLTRMSQPFMKPVMEGAFKQMGIPTNQRNFLQASQAALAGILAEQVERSQHGFRKEDVTPLERQLEADIFKGYPTIDGKVSKDIEEALRKSAENAIMKNELMFAHGAMQQAQFGVIEKRLNTNKDLEKNLKDELLKTDAHKDEDISKHFRAVIGQQLNKFPKTSGEYAALNALSSMNDARLARFYFHYLSNDVELTEEGPVKKKK